MKKDWPGRTPLKVGKKDCATSSIGRDMNNHSTTFAHKTWSGEEFWGYVSVQVPGRQTPMTQ